MLATLTWWRPVVRIHPRSFRITETSEVSEDFGSLDDSPVVQWRRLLAHIQGTKVQILPGLLLRGGLERFQQEFLVWHGDYCINLQSCLAWFSAGGRVLGWVS